ncbi:MAG TPA: hemolysin III family protein [Solirubrobacterales bacterium]|jgi:hemolysin III|nr:hemolysin III family protein [Solirubrobacterales bacterium]
MVEDFRRGAESMGERASAAREAMNERARDAREVMGEKASAAKGVATERAVAAKEAAGERATAAREAAAERALAAKEATVEAIAAVKPKLRGVSHEWAFFVSLVFGAALIFFAKTPKATLAVAIYAVSLSALLGTSALYHRVNWKRPNVRQWMRRLDHSMIFFLIAGTYTPFALLVMHGTLATAILVAVWVGAIAGAIVEMVWIGHPKWVSAITYLGIGWVAAVAFPQLWDSLGPGGALLLVGGGLLYTAGAVVYAIQRPNPVPAVFGYHEVFHAFVIAAALVHFSVIAFFALPHA